MKKETVSIEEVNEIMKMARKMGDLYYSHLSLLLEEESHSFGFKLIGKYVNEVYEAIERKVGYADIKNGFEIVVDEPDKPIPSSVLSKPAENLLTELERMEAWQNKGESLVSVNVEPAKVFAKSIAEVFGEG